MSYRRSTAPPRPYRHLLRALLSVAAALAASPAFASDVSAPALLQWFEGSWQTLANRTPDIFAAGYGGVWTPPPGRADQGDISVGYDPYDRFDLGSAGNPTHYGTQAGLQGMIAQFHQAGIRSYIDLVWNHDGYSNWSTTDSSGHSFLNAGGYPGFWLDTGGTGHFGDFHDPSASGDYNGQTSGLLDIAQESNNVFVRNPVPGYANNLPAGAVPAFGRLANVPTDANRAFYPDQSLPGQNLYDPKTGQNITVYPFNTATPLNGTPVAENALGYLMRNAQWLVQVIGADGFRLDATKNMPDWVLNYYDRAVYNSISKPLLDGSRQQPFAFGEYYGSDFSALQARIRKDINPATPNVIGGNRDTLDFPLYWAMSANLSGNGLANDWTKVINASIDVNDDGLANNGSQGVSFVQAHDTGLPAPYLSNVAYAFTLLRPGNTIVYVNGHELGSGSFPADGRGDALGGLYGKAITTLVSLRNQYGRGNFIQRDLEKETLIYERQDSALVALSNRVDAGYDSRTVQTSFAPGTHLVELTGNAASSFADPSHDIPTTLVVQSDGTVNLRVLRNVAPGTSTFTGDGYLVYGPQSPIGSLSFSNVARTISGGTPTASTNGTTRLSSLDVITGNSFTVSLNTSAVTLSDGFRDRSADGDNALIRLDGGVDVNNNGHVDYVSPGSVAYGFEEFTTAHSPGYFSSTGNGLYSQAIDASKLSEGYHYLDVRAFRQRDPSEPAIFTDFTQTLYVDRLKPISSVTSFNPTVSGVNENRTAIGVSTNSTANNMHFFLDLPASLTDAQVLSMVGSSSQGTQLDVNQWSHNFSGVRSGNHVLTVVSYEVDGNSNVQRFPGYAVSSIYGLGVGDTDFNGTVNSSDISTFSTVLQSNNSQFNPAADVNADGRIDLADTFLLGPRLSSLSVDSSTWSAYNALVNSTFVRSGTYTVSGSNSVYDVTAASTIVTAGSSLAANSIRGSSLVLQANATARLNPNLSPALDTSHLQSLSLAPGSSLDLANNDLVLDSASPDSVRQLLLSGQLRSSSALSSTALGYLTGAQLLRLSGSTTSTWSDQTVSASSVLIHLTLVGDANMDGVLNADDYTLLDKGFATHASTWSLGDFNYDGLVNSADYLLLDRAYALAGHALSPSLLAERESQFGSAYVSSLLTSLPEPTLLFVLPLAFLARRRGPFKSRSRSHFSLDREVRS